MKTRWLVAGAAAVALLVAGAAVAILVTGGSAEGERAAAWQQLQARYGEEGLSAQLALDAFATLVAPVPGGHRQPADALGTASASPAVRWMLATWDELDQAQRDAFVRAVYGDEPAHAMGVAGESLSLVAPPADRDPALEAELRPEVEAIAADFAGRAGITMPRVRVVVSTVAEEEDAYADTGYRTSAAPDAPRGEGRSGTCVITFYPPATEARVGSPEEQETFLVTVAHELYHCHQFLAQDQAGVDLDADLPGWVVEGSADWAGNWYAAQVMPGFLSDEGWWEDYFGWPMADPRVSLYRLSYDALGFFAHLDNVLRGSVGDDVWSTIDAMLVAATDEAAFAVAAEAGGEVFLRQWAMGTFLDPDLGSEWVTTGPGLPELGPSEVARRRLAADRPVSIAVSQAPGITRARVDVSGELQVLRAELTGHGAFHWAGPELEERGRTEWFDASRPQVRWYCFTGQCTCPDGGPAAPDVHPMPPPSTISVALTGGTELASVALVPSTVEELCSQPRQPQVTVRDCDDVYEIVHRYAPHYDEHRELPGGDDVIHCSIEYTVSPELDDFGNYLELGVFDEIEVLFSLAGEERPAACPPEGHCVESRTQHVAAREGIPAHDIVHTDVYTSHVSLYSSEEKHGPLTPTEDFIQITLDIQAGIPR